MGLPGLPTLLDIRTAVATYDSSTPDSTSATATTCSSPSDKDNRPIQEKEELVRLVMASKTSPTPCVQEGKLVEGGWLSSKSCRYQVQSILGEGTFGKVAKCTRTDDSKTVAIKMVKKRNDQAEKANAEVVILEKLKSLNADKCDIVQWYQVFNNNGYICLEFELLDKSLFDLMKERFFRPLFLSEIRPIIKQLANALEHLKSIRLIHADLKLENVMLVNHIQQPYRVKVIDFGLACEVSKAKVCSYIQSRPYRSPEIILGLPFTEAIDMWSLGCIAAALYIGTLLYPGNSSYDVMRCSQQLLSVHQSISVRNLSCSSRAKPPVSHFTWYKESTDGPMNVSEGHLYSFRATYGEVY
ncbi:homeodomain-interacting protein kinase 1-like [Echeneis naucrates]|uniref:homeodomain-interacting protein kinase 1-like n=1 Tax=Echeneis naucrates TaxID=173247 RepID=UPI0011140794|nr:homeodomain-interacting protein kinase 1-like [Echeneis naucrates]